MKSVGFLDLLFNALILVTCQFLISYLLIAPDSKKESIDPKAEFIIMVSWPGDINADIDTWLKDPTGEVLWFRKKKTDAAHLDQDDLGTQNDASNVNQEITTIRAIIPGEWILNIHYYSAHGYVGDVPVDVSLVQLNPTFKKLVQKKIVINKAWQEETVTRFTLTDKGTVIGLNDLRYEMVQSTTTNQ